MGSHGEGICNPVLWPHDSSCGLAVSIYKEQTQTPTNYKILQVPTPSLPKYLKPAKQSGGLWRLLSNHGLHGTGVLDNGKPLMLGSLAGDGSRIHEAGYLAESVPVGRLCSIRKSPK